MKILLIDDEEAILEVFKQALEQANFEVITALTGNEGMEKTKTDHPDVIFLDQVLPDMNGNQVLQQLKADPDTKHIPIAILSNFNQDTLVENAMKMGASDYILKYQIAPTDLSAKATQLLQENHLAELPVQTVQAPILSNASVPQAIPAASDNTQPMPAPVAPDALMQPQSTVSPMTQQEEPAATGGQTQLEPNKLPN